MQEEEFKRLRAEVLRKAGLVNMKLREKFSYEEALKVNDITKEEFTLMGWEYNEKKNQVERVHYIIFNDVKEKFQEQQEEPKELISATNTGSNLEVFSNNDVMQLQDFISNYKIIMEMVSMFKQNNQLDIDNKNLVIELPFEDDKSFKASYRVNKTINEQFKQFCKEHSEFTAKDLLSQALKEFMIKYSK